MGPSVYSIICLLGTAEALPLSSDGAQLTNSVGAFESGWVLGPNQRGTANLLISCSTIMSLCAWTAYRPNVHPNKSDLKQILRQICWLLVAIFVPEVILSCASEQWWTAGRLQQEVNKYLKAGKKSLPRTAEKSKGASNALASDPHVVTDEAVDRIKWPMLTKALLNLGVWSMHPMQRVEA